MQEHIHTGPLAFLFAGVSAVIFLNILRLVAITLASRPGESRAATVIMSLISFGPIQDR